MTIPRGDENPSPPQDMYFLGRIDALSDDALATLTARWDHLLAEWEAFLYGDPASRCGPYESDPATARTLMQAAYSEARRRVIALSNEHERRARVYRDKVHYDSGQWQ